MNWYKKAHLADKSFMDESEDSYIHCSLCDKCLTSESGDPNDPNAIWKSEDQMDEKEKAQFNETKSNLYHPGRHAHPIGFTSGLCPECEEKYMIQLIDRYGEEAVRQAQEDV